MAAYTLDLGVPIVGFLLRLRIADDEAHARLLVSSGSFWIGDERLSDLSTIITLRHIRGWTLVRAGEKQVWVTLYTEDNGLR